MKKFKKKNKKSITKSFKIFFMDTIWLIGDLFLIALPFLILPFIVLALVLSGCANKPSNLNPTSQQVHVVEKKVIVGCRIPEITCDFKGEGFEPTRKLLDCVKTQKEAIKLCNEQADSLNQDQK